MVDFRRLAFAIAVLAVFASLASAQNNFQCQTNTSVTPGPAAQPDEEPAEVPAGGPAARPADDRAPPLLPHTNYRRRTPADRRQRSTQT